MNQMLRRVYLGVLGLAAIGAMPLGTAAAQTFNTLYAFPGQQNGAFPSAGVTAIGSNIYGLTTVGGNNNGGTLFKYSTAKAGSFVTLKSLPAQAEAAANLLDYKGTLYGVTEYGGPGAYGILVSFNPTTKKLTTLHNFSGADGAIATAPLVQVNGILYGTTSIGGVGLGNIFSYDIAAKKFAVVHTFSGSEPHSPANPHGGLVKIGKYLFGTTNRGGDLDNGTVFKLDIANRALTVIYSFNAAVDGGFPMASLTVVNGQLYGTASGTSNQDPYTSGGLFSINPTTGAETTLHTFAGGADGSNPLGALINVNGTLYGTTEFGGANSLGTIFSYTIATQTETVLHSFSGASDGELPADTLTKLNGVLYGTTQEGGAAGDGTLFGLTLPAAK
jgi:uncharacterized repeat protein (TIGR03803 family)